jgi:NDP-sugar pyrophosphorylase family protein
MIKFAIIAAGEGSRLKQEGVKEDKPLVRINGEIMLHRLVRIFSSVGADEIVMVVNSQMPDVVAYTYSLKEEFAGKTSLKILSRSTPSSMHSFYEMSSFLTDAPFCLTTVDTLFREQEFRSYIDAFLSTPCDGMMAVTDYIDDEKPLYVGVDSQWRINGFYDKQESCRYISGGIYGLRPVCLDVLEKCVREGQSRMRNFQRQLVNDGLLLKACPFSKILDIDHAEDILKAEEFVKE